MTPQDRELGARLRAVRVAAGFSQGEVARHLGIVRSAVSAFENGRRKVTAHELRRIARIYGTSAGELLGEDGAAPDELALVVTRLSHEDRARVLHYANYVSARSKKEEEQ